MTPFRSCLVVLNMALAIAILGEVEIKGGVLTYAVVSDVHSSLVLGVSPGHTAC